MPITYRIDLELGAVFTTITGVLTDEEMIRHKEQLVKDPDFRPDLKQLSDVRGIESLDVTPEGVRHFAVMDKEHASRLGEHRLAIVASEDAVFGTARMYQMFTEQNVEHVQVFRDMETAREWLGLPPE